MATYGAFGGLNAGGKKPTPMPGFGDPSPKAPASTGVNNPYSTEGPMPDGSTLAEHVRNGGSPYAGQIGHEFAPAAPKVERNKFLDDALAGYQANIGKLNGMANPWESSMTIGALDRSRAGIAATGARANVHSQNDAIKQMMAGGGLIAQGDLNNMSDNMRAGVTNQQNSLYADYNQRRIGWEDQRQQTLGNQYDRMAGLSEMPGRLEAQGLGNQMLNQQVYDYTKQDAANYRAAMQELEYKNAKLGFDRNEQQTYEFLKPESANLRGMQASLGVDSQRLSNDAQNASNYENNQTRDARLKRVGIDLSMAVAQGQISQAQAEAARQLAATNPTAFEQFMKNVGRGLLVGGGAIAGGLIGGGLTGGLGALQGAAYGAGLGGSAAATIK